MHWIALNFWGWLFALNCWSVDKWGLILVRGSLLCGGISFKYSVFFLGCLRADQWYSTQFFWIDVDSYHLIKKIWNNAFKKESSGVPSSFFFLNWVLAFINSTIRFTAILSLSRPTGLFQTSEKRDAFIIPIFMQIKHRTIYEWHWRDNLWLGKRKSDRTAVLPTTFDVDTLMIYEYLYTSRGLAKTIQYRRSTFTVDRLRF